MATFNVQHDPQNQEFTVEHNDAAGELAYSMPEPTVIDFTHTYVDESLRGQGVAEQLARHALAYAREQQYRVRTTCTFMRRFVQEHADEYSDLL